MRNILTGILILLFFISGCADKTPQPQTAKPAKPQAAKPTAEKPSDAVPAAPSVKGEVLVPIGYEYHSQGRRDPFQSLIIKDVLEKKKGTTPLEQDELSALR
ncbi:MAG: hypothetical protein KG029_16955, partial [Bacteroidetes bacterium]|nr:hypothetical protein [Bacteroidota bacterium]